jgi:hypothetical protein
MGRRRGMASINEQKNGTNGRMEIIKPKVQPMKL